MTSARIGPNGVAVFDGRWGMARCVAEARDICSKRGYIGFTIEAGVRTRCGSRHATSCLGQNDILD